MNVGSNADALRQLVANMNNKSKQAEAGANDDDRPGLFALMLKGM